MRGLLKDSGRDQQLAQDDTGRKDRNRETIGEKIINLKEQL